MILLSSVYFFIFHSYIANRAACHMSLHRPKKALKDALMSIQLNPQFIRGYCRAGKAYLIQGELTEFISIVLYDDS